MSEYDDHGNGMFIIFSLTITEISCYQFFKWFGECTKEKIEIVYKNKIHKSEIFKIRRYVLNFTHSIRRNDRKHSGQYFS